MKLLSKNPIFMLGSFGTAFDAYIKGSFKKSVFEKTCYWTKFYFLYEIKVQKLLILKFINFIENF